MPSQIISKFFIILPIFLTLTLILYDLTFLQLNEALVNLGFQASPDVIQNIIARFDTNSDGKVSLDEFFEVLTWAQLGVHAKPIVLINVKNYWDPLLNLIDHTISAGFAEKSLKNLFKTTDSVDEAVEFIENFDQRLET